MGLIGELSFFNFVTIAVEELFKLVIDEHVGHFVIGDRAGRDDCWDLLVFVVSREDALPFLCNVLLPRPVREFIRDQAQEVGGFVYGKDWSIGLPWDIVIGQVNRLGVLFYSEMVEPVADGLTMMVDDKGDDGGADACCYKHYSDGDEVGGG